MTHSAVPSHIIQELEEDARAHKRIERQQREQARRKYQLAEEMRAFCREHGIPVETVERRGGAQR